MEKIIENLKKENILNDYLEKNKPTVENYWIINNITMIQRAIIYEDIYFIMNINYNDYFLDYNIHEIYYPDLYCKLNDIQNHDIHYEKLEDTKYYLNFCYSGNDCYFHLIFETLLHIFKFLTLESKFNNKNTTILINRGINPGSGGDIIYDVLKKLFKTKIMCVDLNTKIEVENLIIPNMNFNYNYEIQKIPKYIKNQNIFYIDYHNLKLLRNHIFLIFKIKPERKKNIYIKRNSQLRKIININDLNDLIQKYNFEIFEPEKHSFQEQIKYYSQINSLVLQGGSSIANIMFIPEGSTVYYILSDSIFINEKILTFIEELNINLIKIKVTPIYQNIIDINNNIIALYQSDLFLNRNNLNSLHNFFNELFKTNIIINQNYKEIYYKDKREFYKVKINKNYFKNNKYENIKLINYSDLYDIQIVNLNKDIEDTFICYSSENIINGIDEIKFNNNNIIQKFGINMFNDYNKNIINKIDEKLFFSEFIVNTKIYENVLFESKKEENNILTNYDISHTKTDYKKLLPNIETYNNFFENKSNKNLHNSIDYLYIDKAVFFNSLTNTHQFLTHLIYDFGKFINIFYDYLKENKNIKIIIEYNPFNYCTDTDIDAIFKEEQNSINTDMNNKKELSCLIILIQELKDNLEKYSTNDENKVQLTKCLEDTISTKNKIKKCILNKKANDRINNLNNFIKFIRDIGLSNEIIILSIDKKCQNFNQNYLFIKELMCVKYESIENNIWIPLISRLWKNKKNKYFYETIIEIIEQKYIKNQNIHYIHHKKKFFILEKRIESVFMGSERNLNIESFEKIKIICEKYCEENNLKLIIWDQILENGESIYTQFEIVNNSTVIIGFGGSFWLFNCAIKKGYILILNFLIYNDFSEYTNVINTSFFKYIDHFKNKKTIKFIDFSKSECMKKKESIFYEKINFFLKNIDLENIIDLENNIYLENNIDLKNNIIIFGIGNIAEVAYYYLKNDTNLNIVGFCLEKDYIKQETKFDLPIIEFENIQNTHPSNEYLLFAPCTASKLNKFRERIYNEGKKNGYKFYTYISSKSNIYTEEIGDNCLILEDNTIQPYTKIGNNCILWSGNHIGHHSIIEDHVFVTSHVVISGMCLIKKYCYLGVNSSLRDNIILEEGTVVGMSASITKNTEGNAIYMGIPAKKYKEIDDTIIL